MAVESVVQSEDEERRTMGRVAEGSSEVPGDGTDPELLVFPTRPRGQGVQETLLGRRALTYAVAVVGLCGVVPLEEFAIVVDEVALGDEWIGYGAEFPA